MASRPLLRRESEEATRTDAPVNELEVARSNDPPLAKESEVASSNDLPLEEKYELTDSNDEALVEEEDKASKLIIKCKIIHII